MAFDPWTASIDLIGKAIDKIFPDPAQRDAAKLEMLKAQQDGQLKEIEIQMSAIIAEAKSADPWTSRARPSFLYVMYIMILAAIPMGIVSAFRPEIAVHVADGMRAWLAAVPDSLWAVFGVGYTGYTVARSAWDKRPSEK
ncbi:MAG: holin family protein [Pseudomonadota bacterium]